MARTIKIRAEVSGEITTVKCLMLHPMETGTRIDAATGELVAANHITQLTFKNNDKLVMVANFSTAVSRDPYFSFKFNGGRVGDAIEVSWVDNFGDTARLDAEIA